MSRLVAFEKQSLVIRLWAWCRDQGREEYFFDLMALLVLEEVDLDREIKIGAEL